MKQELVELLEAVCNKEKEVIKKGCGPVDSLLRDDVLGFFILSHIKGYLPDIEFASVEQLKEALLSDELYTNELSQIWDNLFEDYHGEILGVHNLVSEFHLQEHEGWNDRELATFMMSTSHPMLVLRSECGHNYGRIVMEVTDRLSQELNLPTKREKILVHKCDGGAISYLFENYKPEIQYVFNDCDYTSMNRLKFFLSDFKNIHILKGDLTQVKEIYGENTFDYAYVGEEPWKNETNSMKSAMELVNDNGMAICVGKNTEGVMKWGRKEFNEYRTPLVFWEHQCKNTVVCIKEPVIEEKIYYFDMDDFDVDYVPYTWCINNMLECFHNPKRKYGIIEVTKEDFLYNKELDFKTLSEVRKGKENYAWKSIDDVLELRTDLQNISFDVDNQNIVTEESLSDNPFDLELNAKFCLNLPNEADEEFLDDVKYVHSGFKLVETEYCPTYEIAQNEGYQKDFYNAFDTEKCTDKELGQFFSKLLTSRMITFDAILRCGNKFRIVHAKEHPVCLQYFRIVETWYTYNYYEPQVVRNMQVYEVKEGYDAEHILHEIMTRGEEMYHYNHPDIHFLVAPDITTQKADYAKKKENYIKELQRKRAEEEAELARLGVRNAVADLAHMLGTTFARQGSIMNTIRLLKEKGLPVADEKMSSLMDSVNYVMRVVQNFGGDFEHTEFEWQNLNACELLKSYCTEWQNAMGKRFATEVYTNECDGTTIKTDPFYLKIMLDSIFENAWRHGFEKNYTENNKVVIDLKQVSYKGRKYLLIRICNNGKPLSNDIDMDAYTTRGRFSETSGRSGLGGNHVYQIVKKHEGYMSIDGSDPEWPFAIEILLPIVSFNNVDVQHYDKSCL